MCGLDGLRPDTAHTYRLFWRSGNAGTFTPTAARSFRTARPPGADFTFTIQADPHLDSNTSPALYARTLANALADAPDFHVDLGDTFMTEKYPVFAEARAQYDAQRYYLGLLAASAPLFLALGNHDGELGWAVDGTPQSMPVWSARLRTQLFPNPVPDGFFTGSSKEEPFIGLRQNYYAWEWGDGLFVVLDPYWGRPPRGQRHAALPGTRPKSGTPAGRRHSG